MATAIFKKTLFLMLEWVLSTTPYRLLAQVNENVESVSFAKINIHFVLS